MNIIHFSWGIYQAKTLRYFFYPYQLKFRFLGWMLPKQPFAVSILVTWGKGKLSHCAEYSASKNKQSILMRLEDGFLRSLRCGKDASSISLIIDKTGIYYDSYCSSDLEILLNFENDFFSDRSIAEVQKKIISYKISKYNHATDLNDRVLRGDDTSRVLVVDQTYGDMSVKYGNASEKSFSQMLDAARTENPSATIYVKTHPEVTSRRKKGYLTNIQEGERVVIIRDDVNPIDLIQQMDKVYVVTSQMGFEALMCGKPVVTFGVPWYAGWGVTDDRVRNSLAWVRRTKKRTVDELFAAAYIHYTHYLNPFTHQRGNIFDVIEWLILQKKMAARPFARDFVMPTHKLPANA